MTFFSKIVSTLITAILLCFASMQIAFAEDFTIAELEILHPHSRAPLSNARVTGGYLTIKNNGLDSDKLLAVKVEFAEKAELHEMKIESGVMKMREVKHGFSIPAGQSVTLFSGGNHIMFVNLKDKLVVGDKRKAVLVFENAGKVTVNFEFESFGVIKKRARINRMEEMNNTGEKGDMHSSDPGDVQHDNHKLHDDGHSDVK